MRRLKESIWKKYYQTKGLENRMKINVLLTGRGNNTLKDKNILDILGNPVMYYIANSCKKAELTQNLYCSSDDIKILNIAEELGYVPIKRPNELALPSAQHIDCIIHGLKVMEENDDFPDILVVALANNVTIKSSWVDDCIKMMLDDMSISCVVPVYQDNDHHPLRAKKIDESGNIQMYENVKGKISTNRQDLTPCYFLSHNIWVLNTKYVFDNENGQAPWCFMGNNIKPYIIEDSIDIHNETDLLIAKEWIDSNYTD